jgi:hypothetical protein
MRCTAATVPDASTGPTEALDECADAVSQGTSPAADRYLRVKVSMSGMLDLEGHTKIKRNRASIGCDLQKPLMPSG